MRLDKNQYRPGVPDGLLGRQPGEVVGEPGMRGLLEEGGAVFPVSYPRKLLSG